LKVCGCSVFKLKKKINSLLARLNYSQCLEAQRKLQGKEIKKKDKE
jgi:hypothetical protein